MVTVETDTATVDVTVTRSTMLPMAVDDQPSTDEEVPITIRCAGQRYRPLMETPSPSPVSPMGPTVRLPIDATDGRGHLHAGSRF